MDCLTARQTLELARPGAGDEAGLETDRASLHVKSCGDCQTAVRMQERFDRRVGLLCRDIPIPAGLKDRLLTAIHQSELADVSGADLSGVKIPMTKVREGASRKSAWLRAGAAAAVCFVLFGLGIWWQLRPQIQTVSQLEIEREVIDNSTDPGLMPEFTHFANGTAVRLPKSMDLRQCLTVSRPKALLVKGQNLAVYHFTLKPAPRSKIKSLQGKIIVLPRALLEDPPTSKGFLLGRVVYAGSYATTAWVEGDLAFVCFLSGGEGELHRLEPRSEGA